MLIIFGTIQHPGCRNVGMSCKEEKFVNKQKILSLIVLGVFLSGCATTDNWTPTGWTRRQTVAATAAAVCGIAGANASGWINHNNGHPLNEGKAIPAGFFGGALLCGGLAYLLTPEPAPPCSD